MSLWSFSVEDVTRTTHFPTTMKGTPPGDAKQEVTAGVGGIRLATAALGRVQGPRREAALGALRVVVEPGSWDQGP